MSMAFEKVNSEEVDILKQYLQIKAEIDQVLEELVMWRTKAEKITREASSMPGNTNKSDRLQTAVDCICELEYTLIDKYIEQVQVRDKIERLVNRSPNPTHRCLLRYRYIEGQTWEAIGQKMNYSYQHVHRLHNKALEAIKM